MHISFPTSLVKCETQRQHSFLNSLCESEEVSVWLCVGGWDFLEGEKETERDREKERAALAMHDVLGE